MSHTTQSAQAIASQFKMTKFCYNNKPEAWALQDAMFSLGFMWSNKGKGAERKYEASLSSAGYIYVSDTCRMTHSDYEFGREDTLRTLTQRSKLVSAAFEHKAAKKAERKLKQHERRMLKDGWIKNVGIKIEKPTDILFRDGSAAFKRDGVANAGDWSIPYLSNPIRTVEWYKLATPVAATKAAPSRAIPLQAMVEAIVKDAGGTEIVNIDSDGYIVWNGGECPVAKGTKIDVKYRDGKSLLNATGLHYTGMTRDTTESFWQNDDYPNDIVAYRLSAIAKTNLELELIPMEKPTQAAPDTNPKKAFGVASIPLNLWPGLASAYGSLALYNGASKYGSANYVATPVDASIYISAIERHLSAWKCGQECDEADGVPHLGAILANVAIILEARAAGMLIDDRGISEGYVKEMAMLKDITKSLTKLHEGKNPKHYTLNTKEAV